jgi:outer membrane protein OmpA-like peptidoglycan-associated protein
MSTSLSTRRGASSVHAIAVGLIAACGVTDKAPAQSGCQFLMAAFDASIERRELAAVVAAANRVRDSLDCPASERARIARRAAFAHLVDAQRRAKAGESAAQQLAILEAGRRYDRPWQLLAAIGDMKQQVAGPDGQIDYAAASTAYQEALNQINDTASTPSPPPRNEIERLRRLADQMRSLSPKFVAGEVLHTRGVRGVEVEAVTVPVQFVYDSDQMTELGRRYAEETAKLLAQQNKPRIRLVGHTDPKGGDEYNDRLSLRRAEAMRRYLVEHGYPADAIEVKGRGKRAPLVIENEASYSVEQIHQMRRRVEVCFKDAGADANRSESCR